MRNSLSGVQENTVTNGSHAYSRFQGKTTQDVPLYEPCHEQKPVLVYANNKSTNMTFAP